MATLDLLGAAMKLKGKDQDLKRLQLGALYCNLEPCGQSWTGTGPDPFEGKAVSLSLPPPQVGTPFRSLGGKAQQPHETITQLPFQMAKEPCRGLYPFQTTRFDIPGLPQQVSWGKGSIGWEAGWPMLAPVPYAAAPMLLL